MNKNQKIVIMIGLIVIVPTEHADTAVAKLNASGETAMPIGNIVTGTGKVNITICQ